MTRFAKATDRSQPGIVAALRAAGCVVIDMAHCGRGVPDLHVVRDGKMYWLECKNPRTANSKAKDDRTDAELKFATLVPTQVVRTPDEALRAVGLITVETK